MRTLAVVVIAALASVAPAAAEDAMAPARTPGRWAVSVFGGWEQSDAPVTQVFRVIPNTDTRADNFVGGAVSYSVLRFWLDFTAEVEVGAGKRFPHSGATEGWAALFVRYHLPWRDTIVTTLAASTGVNYADKLPISEVFATYEDSRARSHLLHYFAPEITFALPQRPEHELFVRVHHRSGAWGVFNGVWGGADVATLGYRYRF